MKPMIPTFVLLILAVIAVVVFYKAQVENPTYMLVISTITFVLALVSAWVIPGSRQASLWASLGIGGVGFVLMVVAVIMTDLVMYVYHPLFRVGAGLFCCAVGAGIAAYFLKQEPLKHIH